MQNLDMNKKKIIFDIDGIWYSLAVAEICASIISVTFLVAKKKKYNY